jgi:predicted DNA-binding transcriptional regulator YafY
LKEYEDGSIKIRLHLIINYELTSAVLGYGSSVEVLEPHFLREKLKQQLQSAVLKYE